MIERGRVTNEDPRCHWEHMDVDGQSRVLDLGCAYLDEHLRRSCRGTPHYYLARGPQFYLGIDQNASDIELLRGQCGDRFICAQIISADQVECWLRGERITHLKSDVEGAEIHLAGITEPLPDLQAAAIEVHGHDVHRAVEAWLGVQGLNLYRIDQQNTCVDVHILYAQKPAK